MVYHSPGYAPIGLLCLASFKRKPPILHDNDSEMTILSRE